MGLENGTYKLNVNPAKLKPVADYVKPQGRFRHLTASDIEEMQKLVDKNWAALKVKVEASQAKAQ